MLGRPSAFKVIAVGALVTASCLALLSTRTVSGRVSDDNNGRIARGAGTTSSKEGVEVLALFPFSPRWRSMRRGKAEP